MRGHTRSTTRRLAVLLLGAGMGLVTGTATAVELARVEGFGPVSRGFAGSGVAFPTGAGAMMLNPAELLNLDREQELLFQLTEIHADIIVSVRLAVDRLRITVADTGPGLNEKRSGPIQSTGVGLANIRDRLAQAYGQDHEFDARARAGGGFEVLIEIPYQTEEQPREAA